MSSVVIAGNTSGSIAIAAPAVAGSNTITLPAETGTLVTSATTSGISGSAISTGTVGVAYGGTGTNSLTANNVLLGNGTSALQVVAPSTSGNVLTSNGTTWTSAAAPAGGATLGTPTTISGTTFTYSGIPSTAKTTIINFNNFANGVGIALYLQLGSGGSVNTSASYNWAYSYANLGTSATNDTKIIMSPAAFGLDSGNTNGSIFIELVNSSTYLYTITWIYGIANNNANPRVVVGSASKQLSGLLDRIQLSNNASASMGGGTMNIITV